MDLPIYVDTGFTGRKSAILKPNEPQQDEYYVDYRAGPDLLIRRNGPNGAIIGTVNFHSFSGFTEISFENNICVHMERDGVFTNNHILPLPVSPETSPFTWKGTMSHGSMWRGGNLKLEDSKGQILALYANNSDGYGSTDGVLSIVMLGLSRELVDQIVISMMAVSEKLRRQRKNKNRGVGPGGGVGGI